LKNSSPACVQHIKVLSENEIDDIVKSAMSQILFKSHEVNDEGGTQNILENKEELALSESVRI
jgi:hypothetical protein